LKHHLIVDLESWVHTKEGKFPLLSSSARKQIDNKHIVSSTKTLLDILKKYNTNVTFCITTEIYDWYPNLIREISNKGHEIGYHSHQHMDVNNVNILKQEFENSKSFFDEYNPKVYQAPRIIFPKDA